MEIKTEIFSPCKVNLMLAITKPRDDGFHDLVSLVSPVRAGDTLFAKRVKRPSDAIKCDMEGVPLNDENLVMRAAKLFRQESKIEAYFDFDLIKRIPAGAGLGGGSSNGAAALLAINELCGNPLGLETLLKLAASLGSDCPLFLTQKPIVMRGRGELVSDLPENSAALVKSLKFLIFKPDFGINTGWAYKQMREDKTSYIPPAEAEGILQAWLKDPRTDNLPLVNNMQVAAFRKFPALQVVLEAVKKEFDLPAMMSGSGSACFAVVNKIAKDKTALAALKALVKSKLGESCFITEA